MSKIYFAFGSAVLLLFWVAWLTFSQEINPKLTEADSLYELDFPSEDQELRAIALYQEVLQSTPDPDEARDFVRSAERLGNLLFTLGSAEEAKKYYQLGIAISKAFRVSDNLVYGHHLFLGELYFTLNRLDSSLFHLQQAESIQAGFENDREPERLYNALGVYFYETGNFNRAVSYFSKAENFLLEQEGDFVSYAQYSFKSNKASALAKLEKYDSAQRIYYDLLELGLNLDQVRINLANTYIEQYQAREALTILDQINPGFAESSLSVMNLKGKALLQLSEMEPLKRLLDQAESQLLLDSTARQSFQKGVHYTLRGDFFAQQMQWISALEAYQKGLIHLHPEFGSEEITANPDDFVVGLSVLSLFETLSKKAHASWQYYGESGDLVYFDLGLDSWRRAFDMARFISTNYDNDQARIFLGDQVLISYQMAIEQLVDFGEKEQNQPWIEQAFAWVEESKAEGLKIGSRLEAQKRKSGIPRDLIQEEQNLLFSISRNYQKQLDGIESEDQLDRERVDLQVALSRLREKMRAYTQPTDSESQPFQLTQLQEQLPESIRVLSLFDSPTYLFVFSVDSENFEWKKIPKAQVPTAKLESWLAAIRSPSFAPLIPSAEIADFSSRLLGEFSGAWDQTDHLMVIPHGQFNALPFELLPIGGGMVLLDKVAVMYQFSARFIQQVDAIEWRRNQISFAPFWEEKGGDYKGFAALPNSKKEVDYLRGEKILGADASRTAFLTKTQNAEILHLATHAVASTEDPNEAFIAFHPGEDEFRVFAPELAFMDLNEVKLVYLSACETGTGKLSQSEGLVSLARSFAFAGVEQMLISQWVSEDWVSAYMSSRFYEHLQDGQSPASSLRLAKLDLLQDQEMVQFHHPYFWANFKLIGQPTRVSSDRLKTVVGVFGLIFFGLAILATLLGWIRHRKSQA